MAANYLHGVETIEVQTGARAVNLVKTGVIGLVGIAPMGESNKPILVLGYKDAAQFGSNIPGFSIPQALDAILVNGGSAVIVVNVFDETKHTTQVTDESQTVVDGALSLSYAPIGVVTVLDAQGDPVAYQDGVDYKIDDYGNFKVLSSAITNGTVLKFTYKRLDQTKITNQDIIGTIDSVTGEYSGMKCWLLCNNLFGFSPKILIAPSFSYVTQIVTELDSYAERFRGIAYADAPLGTTVATAIAGRGPSGAINFNTSSKRVELLFPGHLKRNGELVPYSAFKAGIRSYVDLSEGFFVSDSNHLIKGITGAEIAISASPNDPNTEANLLNEVGITTIFNSFGTGIRTFGNRSAAFPTYTAPDNFIHIRRTADAVAESLELACFQLIDKNITKGWVDTVCQTVNAFIRRLIGMGALYTGECFYYNEDNDIEAVKAGHVVFRYEICPYPSAERLTFIQSINMSALENLN